MKLEKPVEKFIELSYYQIGLGCNYFEHEERVFDNIKKDLFSLSGIKCDIVCCLTNPQIFDYLYQRYRNLYYNHKDQLSEF